MLSLACARVRVRARVYRSTPGFHKYHSTKYRKGLRLLEKDIVAAILRLLKNVPNCFAWKEHGGMYGTAGLPDIIFCLDGQFFAFEVKTPVGTLTKLQEGMIEKIKAAGGHAFVVRSVEDAKAILWAYAGIE